MKKFAFFAAIATAASIAAADSPMPKWDHANDHGEIVGLTEVKYDTTIHSAKYDDRVKYTVAPTGVRTPNGIGHNDTHARMNPEGTN
ncbi:hypothetical protein [Neisseria animalis]|uniref:DUF4148 domain-containing protein n=1 Tax=Neisseria animalis TaxID=492 RepID=A0A5P3MST2_NEIAN|nr:hypothetical protein [Neisseria animalis]QEY23699.1 hypothetical protein D0T90_03585 [Neisseria animalis]ROW32842.1 hypothetical protein CGZ60_03205 [Neisseria animalis]VEE09512.1 Uncharacterised protein [Neisseria animalis]